MKASQPWAGTGHFARAKSFIYSTRILVSWMSATFETVEVTKFLSVNHLSRVNAEFHQTNNLLSCVEEIMLLLGYLW